MLLEFMTAHNSYGARRYLAIDTDNKTYTTVPNSFIIDGIQIKSNDYKKLVHDLQFSDFKKVQK